MLRRLRQRNNGCCFEQELSSMGVVFASSRCGKYIVKAKQVADAKAMVA